MGRNIYVFPLYRGTHGNGWEQMPMNRHAQPVRCRCGQPLLVGLDGDRAALVAKVDARPITAAGEVAALTAGLATYALRGGALDRRDRWNIPGRAPSHELPVHATHDCSQPVPDAWCLPPLPVPPPAILTDLEVPF